MPQTGFKSITVSEDIYNRCHSTWMISKTEYSAKGVSSFAGYVTHQLNELLIRDRIYSKYPPLITVISIEPKKVILIDKLLGRVAEIEITKNGLVCHLCKKNNCRHVGFTYSLHEIYQYLNKQ